MTRAHIACVALITATVCTGCREATTTTQARAVKDQTPTPTALWATSQVDLLLTGTPDSLQLLAKQLAALAVIESGDPDLALQMHWSEQEATAITNRLQGQYDTDWIRGYMVDNTRSSFVHTLMSLHVRDHAPALVETMPGAFGDDTKLWVEWIESNKTALGMY